MSAHPDCPVGHNPPEHPCTYPDCRCKAALIAMSDEMVKARTAAEVAIDALRRAAVDHNCDSCRADAAAVERALEA